MDGRRGANERGPFSPPSQVGAAAAAAAAASRGQSSEEDSSAPRRLASQGTDRPGVVIRSQVPLSPGMHCRRRRILH